MLSSCSAFYESISVRRFFHMAADDARETVHGQHGAFTGTAAGMVDIIRKENTFAYLKIQNRDNGVFLIYQIKSSLPFSRSTASMR